MNYQVPSVLRKGSRSAIVLSKGRKLFEVIQMDSKKLLVRKLDCQTLERQGYKQDSYPVAQAAEQFLRHQAGLSPNAQAALEELLDSAFLL